MVSLDGKSHTIYCSRCGAALVCYSRETLRYRNSYEPIRASDFRNADGSDGPIPNEEIVCKHCGTEYIRLVREAWRDCQDITERKWDDEYNKQN
jgi:hypothetical protein